MCGIIGIWNLNDQPIKPDQLVNMNNSIKHRGPDDEGYMLLNDRTGSINNFVGADTIPEIKMKYDHVLSENNAVLGVGFRRLSIIDLSPSGHQPMCDSSHRYWIAFNGEIYNYIELREELKLLGNQFSTKSDTEVILTAYRQWGESCLQKFNGMWAFVIYDTLEKLMLCSCDRFGIKPFYYIYIPNKLFAFASEIKSLLVLKQNAEPDYQSLGDYFSKGSLNNNGRTYYKDIQQLKGGANIIVNQRSFHLSHYYQPPLHKSILSFSEATEQFRELFRDAVRLRQRTDVPFGYALSGGIDSSSIVCTAANLKNVSSNATFSLIFPGYKVDESRYIHSVLNKTKFDSKFVSINADDLLSDLDKFVWHQEEPFGGLSYFGEFKLRELIHRSGVTVVLDGQGADEMVSGYESLLPYYYYDLLNSFKIKSLLSELEGFKNLGNYNLKQIIKSYIAQHLPSSQKKPILNSKYPYLKTEFLNLSLSENATSGRGLSGSYLNDALIDTLFTSSIPQLLSRSDKNSMAFSIESRYPFLDYRLVEFAMSLPYYYKMHLGTTKYVLREAMKDYLPTDVYSRKDKIGFAVPLNNWVNEPLWEYLMDNLNKTSLNLIDKEIFKKEYPSKATVDWKFWKIMSLIIWQNKTFETNS